jgi:hypothetical protein
VAKPGDADPFADSQARDPRARHLYGRRSRARE